MRHLILSAAICAALMGPAMAAQTSAPPASKDPLAAPAGAYKLDLTHTSIIARIGHGNGFSYSTFRFAALNGVLDWNPADPIASKVSVAVDAKSIATPVEGFAAELQEANYLNVEKFPQITFASRSAKRTDATHGEVTGDLTLRGQTRPVTFKVEMLGAGENFTGAQVVGFTGSAKIKRSDFGFGRGIPIIADEVELQIDVEFKKS
jgi:polyisoprenoid-binding protein YceI